MSKYEEKLGAAEAERGAKLNELAKSMTGMNNWGDYAKREASFMAWNDVQQHGQLSSIRHDEKSGIQPGQTMTPCMRCRGDIVDKMNHKEVLP